MKIIWHAIYTSFEYFTMILVRNIQFLRISLLSIVWSIFLLSNILVSQAFTGTCNAGNIPYSTTYTCNTWYTGSTPLFYSIETTTNIQDANYNVSMQNNGANIVFRNTNGFLWATISNLKIHYADALKGATGATGASAYEGAIATGYTWTIFEWLESLRGPIGATGTTEIVFASGAGIFSGALFSLDASSDNAILDASGSYLPIVSKIDWTYYIDYDRMGQLLILVLFGVFMAIAFWYYIYKKIIWKKSFYS